MGFRHIPLTASPTKYDSTLWIVGFHLVVAVAFLAVLLKLFTPNPTMPRGARKKPALTRNPADVQALRDNMVNPPGILWTVKLGERPQSLRLDRMQHLVSQGRHTLAQRSSKNTSLPSKFTTTHAATTSTTVPSIQDQLLNLANEALQLSLAYGQSSASKCFWHFILQLTVLMSASAGAASGIGYLTGLSEQTVSILLPMLIALCDGIDNLLTLEKDCTIEYNLSFDLQRLHDNVLAALAPGAPNVDLFQFYQDQLDLYDQYLLDNSLAGG